MRLLASLGASIGPVALPNGHRSAIAIGRY